MPPEENGTTEPTTPVVEEAQQQEKTGMPSESQKTAEEWEKSYKGLQAVLQKQKDASDKIIADLNLKLDAERQKIEELTQVAVSEKSQMTTLQTQITKLTEETETLSKAKARAEAKNERVNLILADFPELATWESQGLLPQAETTEGLVEALTKFRSTLGIQVGTQVQSTLAGAIPAGTGRADASSNDSTPETEQYVWEQLVKYSGRDSEKYAQWQAKWDLIQAKKAQESAQK